MNKRIIIGATSGIGKNSAMLYAKTDAKIGLIGRREEKLKELYLSNPDKYIYKACDISTIKQAASCLDELATELGGMDLIIISAGMGEINHALDFNVEEPTILTNVLGWTNIADWSFRYFQNQGHGNLVTISSVGGLRGDGLFWVAPVEKASKQIIHAIETKRKIA